MFVLFAEMLVDDSTFEETVAKPRTRRSYDNHRTKGSSDNVLKINQSGDRSAIFATENSTVITAQIGGTATLPCIVRKFSQGVVSI